MFKLIVIYRSLPSISELDINCEGLIVSIDDTRVDPSLLNALAEHEVARGKREWERLYGEGVVDHV